MSSIRKRLGLEETTDLNETKSIRDRLGLSDGFEEDIAPTNKRFSTIETAKRKEEDTNKWFKGGAASDGYDFGDITKNILGTSADVGIGVGKGIVSLAEGIVDLGRYGVAGAADLLGADKYAKKVKETAKENTTEFIFGGMEKAVDQWSVLGDKADNISQGIGYIAGILGTGGLGSAAGLGTAGTTALTTGTTFTSSMGGGMSEAYQGGATDDEAVKYGLIAGAAEAGTELLFGGLGKAVGAVGLSTGTGLDDALAKKISSKFSSQLAKNLTQYGVKAAAEGSEEVLSGLIQGIGKYVTYQTEQDGFDLGEIIKDEELLDQFIAGAVTSGVAQSGLVPGMKKGSLIETTKQGRDFITGYTQNEQAILDKEIELRKAEASKDGKKLSNIDIVKIENQVKEDLENGNISIELIESELGGDTYNQYIETTDKVRNIENEIKELSSKKITDISVGEYNDATSRVNALQEELRKIDTNTQRSKLDAELGDKIKSDMLLQRSYVEKSKKSQTYNADLTKYDAKQKKTIQSAIDSGILNNTRKTHEFVDMVAKISADKGVSFNFANSQKIKDSGFAVEGKNVDGFVNQNGITLNIESNNALNKVVGHEITHVLEGTDLYTDLQTAVKDYATTKGVWDTKLAELTERYKNVAGVNVENELTSDLVGEYLFTDSKFVNDLSTNKPNVFQKIYNEVKYMLKVATAGSKEARQLEKVKKTFEDAYKNSEATLTNDTKYELSDKKNINEIKPVENGYTRLYRGLNNKYDSNYDRTTLDNSNGYESFTDNYELAKRYAGENGHIYYVDIPTNQVNMNDIIDNEGERSLAYFNDKPVDLDGIHGEEYMLYTYHDNYNNLKYTEMVDDTKYSISDEIAPREAGNTYSEDVKLEEQLAPLQDQVSELSNQITELSEKLDKQLTGTPVTEADLPMMEQQYNEAPIEDIAPPEQEITIPEDEVSPTKSLFETRDYEEVGDRKVNAYQYDHPEVRPYFQETAIGMLGDLEASVKGERMIVGDISQVGDGNYEYVGTTRTTTNDIAELLDGIDGKYKLSYADIEKGLKAIIEDNGAENIAAAKRIEFYLDQRLREGYDLIDGTHIEPNQEYLNLNTPYNADEAYNEWIKTLEAPVTNASNTNELAPTKEQYEAIEPNREAFNKGVMKRIKEVERDLGYTPKDPTKESSYEEIAKVLDTEPTTENTRNKRKAAIVAANVLDKGLVFENVALKNKNRNLMGKWDYTLTSEARAQNVIGNGHYENDPVSKTNKQVSKSLNDIRAEVDNTGLTKQFYEYMYHKHNVDRMSLEGKYEDVKNKPVFGNDVDAAASQEIVNQYEFSNPEFMDYAQDVYNYLEADRNQLVKEGVISQETADLWQEMYPHYVPIRRVDSKGLNINVPLDTGRTGVNAPIKKATGGNTDILPLFDTMAQRTLQTYRATAKNSFGIELKNTLGTTLDSQQTNIDDVIDNIDTQDGLLQENDGKPTFTVFENGEKVTFAITQDMYDAMKPLNDSSILSKTFTPLNVASSIHRGLLTQYNPIFALTNGIKDAQDILINSQHPAKTYSKLGEAWGQYLKKGYWYNEYVANGGEQNSYFDSQDNSFKTENTGIKKILDLPPLKQIAQLNDFIEIGPRLAEYIASREAGRSVEVSMLDAARVTTNFKAGGNVTKFLNRNGATFLNASIQGAMQQVRNIREAKANGVKGWASLATKFAVAGLPAVLLNALLWDDDDEYDELSDYVKQNYYIVGKDDEGNFIRIPKGRTLAVIQEGIKQVESIATGNDEADLKTFIDLALNNLAPNNPIESNIFSPIVQVANNKTWYGGDLVPTRLQDLPAAEQYDESTDNFSRWLGETLNVSPYKVNYMLNQYSGGLGDVVMPMMTPEATTNAETTGEQLLAPLKSKFTSSSVMNNQNTADFYETSEKLTTEAKKSNATDEDVLKNKFINSVKAEMNDLYKQKRDIQNSNLSKSEKYNQVLEVQRQINNLTENALNDYENVEVSSNYAKVGDREYRLNKNEEWEKIDAKQLEKQNEVTNYLGIEPNAYWGNKEEYDYAYESPEKYAVSKAVGGYDTYKSYSKELYNLKADKDSEGKSISGSRKEKVLDYVNNLDADYGSKIILYKSEYPSDDSYNNDIIDYLNEKEDISYEEMVTILTELDMTVDADGNIHW